MKKLSFLFIILLTFFHFSFTPKKKKSEKSISIINIDSCYKQIRSKEQMHHLKIVPKAKQRNSNENEESIGGGELSQEEFSDELSLDSIWSTISDYYAVWDSHKVNPYGIEGDKFKDTITIPLYSLYSNSWSMPIQNSRIKITSAFGMRKYRWHYGTDLKLEIGDSVRTVFDGMIRMVNYNKKGYGNYVVVRHSNGLETLYGHLKKAKVEVGQVVKAGDVIGLGGNTGRSTGSHLHFEIRYQGNAINPEYMFNFKSDTLVSSQFTITPNHFDYLRELKKVRYHTIRKGDNLSTISNKHHIRITTLCKLNHITKKTILLPGRKLRVN